MAINYIVCAEQHMQLFYVAKLRVILRADDADQETLYLEWEEDTIHIILYFI